MPRQPPPPQPRARQPAAAPLGHPRSCCGLRRMQRVARSEPAGAPSARVLAPGCKHRHGQWLRRGCTTTTEHTGHFSAGRGPSDAAMGACLAEAKLRLRRLNPALRPRCRATLELHLVMGSMRVLTMRVGARPRTHRGPPWRCCWSGTHSFGGWTVIELNWHALQAACAATCRHCLQPCPATAACWLVDGAAARHRTHSAPNPGTARRVLAS